MPANFAPVGAALPPRRDQVVAASAVVLDAPPVPKSEWDSYAINVPRARDRMLEFFEREQLPGDVRSTLAAALNGDLHYQTLLFIAMIDSWPKLQGNLGEMCQDVATAPWQIVPFAQRGEEPDEAAKKFAKEIEEMVWRMKPDAKKGENALEETIASLAMNFFTGHGVHEIRWKRAKDGSWRPRATKPVPARYYGYPYDEMPDGDPEERLMFDPDGMTGARNFVDFPDHRFLIAIHKGHPGHPSVAAPLRALAPYWLAAVYGLKWFMNFTQLYGIPWRHAEISNPKDRNVVEQAMAGIGANGFIVTESGVKINVIAPPSTAGQTLPQRELIELADKQCDTFILGQTLTSGTDKSGSRALGEVHEDTRAKRVKAVEDFVGRVLTYQLIPSIVAVNWGEGRDDMPEMWAKRETAKNETELAERDEKIGITSGKTPVQKAWFYERHGSPVPNDGDELLVAPDAISPPSANGAPGDPVPGGSQQRPHETKPGEGNTVEAADAG